MLDEAGGDMDEMDESGGDGEYESRFNLEESLHSINYHTVGGQQQQHPGNRSNAMLTKSLNDASKKRLKRERKKLALEQEHEENRRKAKQEIEMRTKVLESRKVELMMKSRKKVNHDLDYKSKERKLNRGQGTTVIFLKLAEIVRNLLLRFDGEV
jgi:hypothetical protein